MSILSEMMLADAQVVLNDIGEPAVYHKITGENRSILVIIERQPLETNDQPRGVNQPVKIWGLNDATDGILASEVLTNETITFPEHIDSEETVTKRISKPAGESHGWTILELT